MAKKTVNNSARSVKKTRGGSASNAKKTSHRKVVDPMLVNPKTAEENNTVLDEALADLELAQEQAEEYDEIHVDEKEEDVVDEGFAQDIEDIYGELEEVEIEDILKEGDEEEVEQTGKKKKKAPRLKKNGKPKMKVWKKVLIVFLLLVLAAGGYVAWYVFTALGKATTIFAGNPLDIMQTEPLEKDKNGRTNILIFGTSEDEEGHGGAMLADSILVLSADQETNDVKTFSVPRDLWVNYSIEGEETLPCWVGYRGKINATYMCAKAQFDDDKAKASAYFARKVSEVTGVDIQYYVAVDWTVLITLVDTLGGIDVDVWATDERGISDICQQLKMPKGMNYNIDGETALKLARARGACHYSANAVKENYGLVNSNFDREKNQQRIITAIKNKALNIGVLADPTKVLTMLDTLGENIKTNITMSQVRTALNIALNLQGDIQSIETQKLFSTGMINGQSSVVPHGAPLDSSAPGLYDYSDLHEYFQEEINKKPTSNTESTETDEDAEDEAEDE